MNRYKWSISKISAYIRIFCESDEDALNWESMHVDPEYQRYYNSVDRSLTGRIRSSGAAQLGFLASGLFIICTLYDHYKFRKFYIEVYDIMLIILSVVLFLIILKVNKAYNKKHYAELNRVIGNYKKRVESKSK